MFAKTGIALVLLIGTASSGPAAAKTYGTDPAHNVFDIRGKYVGSDPDPTIRAMMQARTDRRLDALAMRPLTEQGLFAEEYDAILEAAQDDLELREKIIERLMGAPK